RPRGLPGCAVVWGTRGLASGRRGNGAADSRHHGASPAVCAAADHAGALHGVACALGSVEHLRRVGGHAIRRRQPLHVLMRRDPSSDLGARLYATVEEYAGVGAHHRTGTAEDARTLDWFEDRLRALGATTERQPWSF